MCNQTDPKITTRPNNFNNNAMKTFKLTLLGWLFLAPMTLFAQPENNPPAGKGDREKMEKDREEKIDRLKIAFITTELALTSSEAEKFWPVYNELEAKIKELRKANKKIEKELQDSYETMTNEDAKKKMNTIFENEEKETALRKEYAEKFSKIIGDKRTLKLLSLEHEFRRELLDRLREQGPPPPQPNRNENGR
jgi:septal ring factor EnvC (AmiA/AmiB activator)